MANNLSDLLSTRVARLQRASQKRRFLRVLGGRGAATLALAGMLSVGGITQGLDGVHFLVEKDLDVVRVVKQDGHHHDRVVARIKDGFAGNSVFKLSRALPDRFVTQEISLFNDKWIADSPFAPQRKRDVFHEEMARINAAIKRDFFAESVPFGTLIHEKAEKYDVDPALVAAVMETESRFRTRARSQVGAQGLMQLMPRTGRWMGARNLYDPEQNVEAGTKYLKYLSGRFDGNLKKTIAAYNAGEGNVMRYNGVPPFRETRQYVNRVMSKYEKRQRQLQQYDQKQGSGAVTAQPDAPLTAR